MILKSVGEGMWKKYEQLKAEVSELVFFTIKLLLHGLILVIILSFVLIILWIHQLFRKSYSTIDSVPADAQEAVLPTGSVCANRTRREQQSCSASPESAQEKFPQSIRNNKLEVRTVTSLRCVAVNQALTAGCGIEGFEAS
jgi:hypothetical protein